MLFRARELGLCYAAIAAITDYDVGLQESLIMDPRHMDAVLEIFKMDIQKTKSLYSLLLDNRLAGFHVNARLPCLKLIMRDLYDKQALRK